MTLGKDLSNDLCPNCEYIELKNSVKNSKVVGYQKMKECVECQTRREADKQTHINQRIIEIKNVLVNLKMKRDAAETLGYVDLVSQIDEEVSKNQSELNALSE